MLLTRDDRYSASYAASLTESQRAEWLESLTDEQIAILRYDWSFWARDKQLPPPGDWFCWLLRSGRGFGKTRTGSEMVRAWASAGFGRIALIGQTVADVRDTMIETEESSILNISPPWFMPDYIPSKRRLVWPNGATATTYSGDQPDQLRGPQHHKAWVDELAKFKYPQETWDNMELGLRLGEQPQVVVTTTPRPIAIIKRLLADPRTVDIVGSTYENIANLAPLFIERIMSRYEGTHLGQQELHGAILADREGALWNRALIEAGRVSRHPDLTRVVVAVDPPGGRAECGIIVGGTARIQGELHGFVTDDRSLAASPAEWGEAVVTAYNHNRADRIVAEINFGGDMVENTVRVIDPTISYLGIRASRGKAVRAEPVVALYEQGRVHHVGQFAALEDELCSWVPDEGMPSPNRLDALVWLITELMIGAGSTWSDVSHLGQVENYQSRWA